MGGLEGSKISFFLGSKPTQDPMNNVFEQKFFWGKLLLTPGPPTEKIFGPGPGRPGPGRPGRVRGQPKGGQNRSVGVCNPSKTVGHPPKTLFLSINICRNVLSSQSYAQNMFLACVGGFLGRFGPGDPIVLCSRPQNPQKSPKFENSKKIF